MADTSIRSVVTHDRDDLYPSPVVRSYRDDLDRVGDRLFLRSQRVDGRWLADALWLERLSWFGRSRRDNPADMLALVKSRFRRQRQQASILDGAGDLEPGVGEVLQRAEEMESSGGLLLSISLLSCARILWEGSASRGSTLALVQMGRVTRTLGDHQSAMSLYRHAERLGRTLKIPVVLGRALLGQGAIHHEAGRLEQARVSYRQAVRVAPDIPCVTSMASLGLSAIALKQGDVSDCIRLGLQALRTASGREERRAEVLVNLAQVALVTGSPRHALGASRWILRRKVHERTRLLAIGVQAIAAARLALPRAVRQCEALARREASTSSLPYPTAIMWSLIARAEVASGLGSASRSSALRARTSAAKFGFHQVQSEADQLLTTGQSGPAVSGKVINRLQLALAQL